jgi:hypothetical protein
MSTVRAKSRRLSGRSAAAAALVAATAGALLATTAPAAAAPAAKVTLCHATGSTTNPYVRITVAAAGAYNGHYSQHEDNGLGDIIPPFTFRGQTYSLNWDADGRATFRNNCKPKGGGGGGYPGG